MIYCIYKDSISLNEFVEFCNILNNDVIEESFKDNLNDIKNKLFSKIDSTIESLSSDICKKFNIDNRAVKQQIKPEVSRIKQDINKNGISSFASGARGVSRVISDALLNSDSFMDSIAKYVNENDQPKIAKAVRLLIFVLIISAIVQLIALLAFGSAGNIIVSTIIAPIIEDGAKAIAVRGEYGAVYNVIFNAFEFSSYISMFSLNRYSIGKGILVRIPAIAMHSINTFIQYLTTNEKFQKILHINKDDEESKKKLRVIGQILSTLIHAIYNSLGVRYNNNIMDFMTT